MITEDGCKLARTPVYAPASNFQKRSTRVNLDEEGAAEISIKTQYGNAQFEENARMLFMEPIEKRKRIMNSLTIPNMQISTLDYLQPDKDAAVLNETIYLKCTQLLTKGGDKLFLTLNLLNRQENTITSLETRKTFFSIDFSYNDEDEIIYTIPKGYKVEFIPKDIVIESEFGKYTATVVLKENTLVHTRTKMMIDNQYPPEKYDDFVAFYKKCTRLINKKVSWLKYSQDILFPSYHYLRKVIGIQVFVCQFL